MLRFGAYRRVGLLALLALVLGLVLPAQAALRTRGPAPLDPAATAWLAQANDRASTTFIVALRDDGTQPQADQARAIGDKLSRRTHVYTLLKDRASRNSAALRTFLRAQGLENVVQNIVAFQTFNGFSLSTTRRGIEALRSWDMVDSVELEASIQLERPQVNAPLASINAVEWNITKIGADRVQTELGITGQGVVVGGMDTGVRYTHEALSANYKCAGSAHTDCWRDPINNQTTPYDDNGHGTHTMGTSVGSGGIGVAPGAKWIACKAFTGSGSGVTTAILACFDWFLAPGGNPANAPDVVNNSWGNSSGSTTTYQQAVTNWVNAGIYPEFSNGNSGSACNTVGAPASYTNAVGTGATDSNDLIASFSSRGPSPFGVIKPDLVAPGVSVRSSFNSSDTGYSSLSGTSMAGPHVTGLVALLLSANPALTISQLTANMKANALPIAATACSSTGVPNNAYGWGRIRAYESVLAALGGGPTPTPTTPTTPTPTTPPTPTPIPTITPTPPPVPVTVFFDDFVTNKGWTVNSNGTDTAAVGEWERGNPQRTTSNGVKQLGATVSGVRDLVTGRQAGAAAGANDIDGGVTTIRSPAIVLPSSGTLTLSFSYYLAHGSNSSSADYLRVRVVSTTTALALEELGAAENDNAAWTTASYNLSSFAGQTVTILIEAADTSPDSLVEAAIDDVRIIQQ